LVVANGEGRRHGVDGEEDICEFQAEQRDQQGGGAPLPVFPGNELVTVDFMGDREVIRKPTKRDTGLVFIRKLRMYTDEFLIRKRAVSG
jgi:hypothetical protein